MDSRVRNLYKRLIFLARDYPRGISEARRKLRAAFKAPASQPLVDALAKGEYVARELETLVYLHKYRTLFRRYEDPHQCLSSAPEGTAAAAAATTFWVLSATALPPSSLTGMVTVDSMATVGAAPPATATAAATAAAATLLTFSSLASAAAAAAEQQQRNETELLTDGGVGAAEVVLPDGGGSGGGVSAPPAPGRPVFCAADTLGGLLRQFVIRQEGFDSGLQLDGLLAYYRRLGCSPQQLQEALETITAPLPGPGDLGLGPTAPSTTLQGGGGGGAAAAPRVPGYNRQTAGTALVEADVGRASGLEGLSAWGASQLQSASWELLAAATAAAAAATYQSRPRGWSRQELLEVRSSPIAGRGVFARTALPPRTLLGAYPGRVRSPADMVAKVQQAPMAASYAFRTADCRFLDPTDTFGDPSPYPGPGWPWPIPLDTTLAFVNEPPKDSPGTNTTVEDGPTPDILHFVTVTYIPAGGEVLIDYGISYDRSEYGIRRGG